MFNIVELEVFIYMLQDIIFDSIMKKIALIATTTRVIILVVIGTMFITITYHQQNH